MPKAKIETEFTKRTTMSLMSDVATLVESTNRILVQVEILAKEHGLAIDPDLSEAAQAFRTAVGTK